MAAVQPTAIQRLAQELKTFNWHYNPEGSDDKSKASAKQEQKIKRIIAKCKPQDVWDLWEQVAPAKFPVPFGLKAKKKPKPSKIKPGLPLHPSKAFQRRQELELGDPTGEVARWNLITRLVMLAGELGCTVPKLTKEQIKQTLGDQLKQVTPEMIIEAEAERLKWRANSLQDQHVLDVFVGYVEDGMTTPEQIRELFGQIAAGKILSEVSRRKDRAKFEEAANIRRNGNPSVTDKPEGVVKGKTMKTTNSNPVSKKNIESASRDRFGCREGSQAAEINAAITGTPASVEELSKKTGLGIGRIRSHLKSLLEKGFVREEEGGFTDGSSQPVKATKPPKGSAPAKASKLAPSASPKAKAPQTKAKPQTSVKTQARAVKNGKAKAAKAKPKR